MTTKTENEKGFDPELSTVQTQATDEIRLENIFGSNAPPRILNVLDIISAGFNICNTWAGVAATLFLGFLSGGSVTVVWGLVVSTFVVGCCALSLAELSARYPTSGGQYHFTFIIAPASVKRVASYATGMINIFSWLAIIASVCVILPQIALGIAVYWNPTYIPQKWQYFLIFQASNLLILAYNIGIMRRAPWTHTFGLVFSLLCFFTFWIACLAMASPKAPADEVWTLFVNEGTGWPNGVVFLVGIVNPNFGFVGIDGAVHLAEDAINAATAVPWALVAGVGIGFLTAFPFVVAMFYCINDVNAILESPIPIFGIFEQALSSPKGATAMTVFIFFIGYFSLNASIQTASRLTWSFARDGGLIFSKQLGHIHEGLGVPVWALLVNSFVVFIFGCIYLGSTVAFNAIVACCLILMHINIAIPIVFLMLSGRNERYLPRKGHWNMGMLGWLYNFISVVWAVVVLIFYCFPTTTSVTGSTMNYASVVLFVILLFSIINWFVWARRNFTEPKIDFGKLERLERMTTGRIQH